jgi:hypothetical protein
MKGKNFVAKKQKIRLKHDSLDLETCYFDQRFSYIYQQECVELWWKSIGANIKIKQYYTFFCNNLV